jgi:hypothetical protein
MLAAGSHLILDLREVGRIRTTEPQAFSMLELAFHPIDSRGAEDSITQ